MQAVIDTCRIKINLTRNTAGSKEQKAGTTESILSVICTIVSG